jgi:hypothetical protein
MTDGSDTTKFGTPGCAGGAVSGEPKTHAIEEIAIGEELPFRCACGERFRRRDDFNRHFYAMAEE